MESHELLRDVLQKHGAKQIADELGLSLSMIYKWGEASGEVGSGSANPLDRIESLITCTKDRAIVQWICQKAGGFFIENAPSTRPNPYHLMPATNEIIQEFADLLAVIAQAAVDNQISGKESKDIRARWEELKTVTETFVRSCEESNFTPVTEKLDLERKKKA